MKTSRPLLLSAITFISSIGYATTLETCHQIPDNNDRLACYDSLATKTLKKPQQTSNWRISSQISPIDDKETKFLTLYSSEKIANSIGDLTATPILIIRCQNNTTELFINWDRYLGSNEQTVTLRKDKEKAETQKWGMSTDGSATFSPQAVPLLKSLIDSNTDVLIAQTTPYSSSAVVAIFHLTGLEQEIKPIRELCNW